MTKDGILRNHLSLITKPNSPMNQSALRNTFSDSATFSFKYGTSDAPTSSQKTKSTYGSSLNHDPPQWLPEPRKASETTK